MCVCVCVCGVVCVCIYVHVLCSSTVGSICLECMDDFFLSSEWAGVCVCVCVDIPQHCALKAGHWPSFEWGVSPRVPKPHAHICMKAHSTLCVCVCACACMRFYPWHCPYLRQVDITRWRWRVEEGLLQAGSIAASFEMFSFCACVCVMCVCVLLIIF